MPRSLNPYVLIYLAAIVVANVSFCLFGPKSAPINAFLFIGLDLSLRDRLHDGWMGRGLWPRMGALIVAGSLISYALSLLLPGDPQADMGRVALASMTAFGGAALADAVVYTILFKRGFLVRANGSNLAGALVDSVLFLTLATGLFLPWVILGQFAAKAGGGFVWSLVLNPGRPADASA